MIENINTHINHLDSLSNRLFEIKTVLQEMEDGDDYDTYVECKEDGNTIRIRIVCDECSNKMVELKNLLTEGTDIIYDPEGDCYKIDSAFNFWY